MKETSLSLSLSLWPVCSSASSWSLCSKIFITHPHTKIQKTWWIWMMLSNVYQLLIWMNLFFLLSFLHLQSPILINPQMGLFIEPQVFMSFLNALFVLIPCTHLFTRFLLSLSLLINGFAFFYLLIDHLGDVFSCFGFQDWIFMALFDCSFYVILIVLGYVLSWVLDY